MSIIFEKECVHELRKLQLCAAPCRGNKKPGPPGPPGATSQE